MSNAEPAPCPCNPCVLILEQNFSHVVKLSGALGMLTSLFMVKSLVYQLGVINEAGRPLRPSICSRKWRKCLGGLQTVLLTSVTRSGAGSSSVFVVQRILFELDVQLSN